MNNKPSIPIPLDIPELYIDRELSLLAFNKRVLALGQDDTIPLLERLKFLCISCANLDEFFEIRVAGIKQQADNNLTGNETFSLNPVIALAKIHEQAHELVREQYQCLNEQLLPALQHEGIHFLDEETLQEPVIAWLEDYFDREILPILTPIRLHASHPFPLTINKGLCLILHLHDNKSDKRDLNLAIVPAPRVLPRFVRCPQELVSHEYGFIYLSSIIQLFAHKMFPDSKLRGCYQLRITRNSDLFVDLEEVEDLLHALEGELPSRRFGDAVRLEVSDDCPKKVTDFLMSRFKLEPDFLYQNKGPVNLNRLMKLPDLINRPDLHFPKFKPRIPRILQQKKSIFAAIKRQDILLHHPFESFLPVIELIREAARDPSVLVIKQTLYRTGEDSVILDHLMDAARAGKEVIVVIELMARFDEETNISTATKLQKAGVHVVFGMVGRKTHAKMLLVVRRENGKIKRYCHLGTGNYHQLNTQTYTDYGFLTADKIITEDVHKLFMQLTTYGDNLPMKKLVQSPNSIRDMVVMRINQEIENANHGKAARIVAKMNGLVSPVVIQALYQASQAGVEIDLIVRGICCLRPGVAGVSENIRVHSILGRFLEHGRVYWFHDDGADHVYCSSADWMPRNLLQRVEQAVPIEDPGLKQRLIDDLELYLRENQHRWVLQPDGRYELVRAEGEKSIDAQQQLLQRLTVRQ